LGLVSLPRQVPSMHYTRESCVCVYGTGRLRHPPFRLARCTPDLGQNPTNSRRLRRQDVASAATSVQPHIVLSGQRPTTLNHVLAHFMTHAYRSFRTRVTTVDGHCSWRHCDWEVGQGRGF
jgi:hypothetical protein